MNTLQNSIEKLQNAKRITEAFCERVRDVVLEIENIMDEIGVNSLIRGKYILRSINKGADTSLYLVKSDYYSNIEIRLCSKALSATNESYYIGGNFDMCTKSPNLQDLKTFVSDLSDILSELAEGIPKEEDDELCEAEKILGIS